MESAAGRRGTLRWVAIAVAAVLAVAGVVAAVLLTNGSEQQKMATGPTRSSSPPPDLQVHTVVSRVAGALPAPRRRSLERHVGDLVKGYLQAAFVEDRSGTAAFPGFTPAARRLAARDAKVLTAGSTSTEVKRALAFVSVFADHRRAQGATVHLILSVAADGGRPRPLVGRLLLTPTSSGWRVFGFHVARGTRR